MKTNEGVYIKNINNHWFHEKTLYSHSGKIICLAPSFFHPIFASGSSDGSICLWGSVSNNHISTLQNNFGAVNCLIFDRKFGNLFSGGEEMHIKCWDLEKETVVRKFKGHFSSINNLTFHPLLNVLVSCGRDRTIRIWDLRIKREIKTLAMHSDSITSVLVKNESPHLISSSLDKNICLWDLVFDAPIGFLIGHQQGIKELRKSSKGSNFISLSSDSIIIWRKDGSVIKKITNSEKSYNCFGVSKNNELAISYHSGWIRVFPYGKRKESYYIRSCGRKSLFSQNKVSSICFSASDDKLMIGNDDKSIEIFSRKWKSIN